VGDRDDTLRGQAIAFAGIAVLASALSVAAFHYQLRSLTIGGRDLGFFMASYERLLELPPWRELAVQPNGNNAFGFTGLDGHPTLHHDIHLSPLKYALAVVYEATGSWLAVELVLVSTVLAALAYALVRWHRVAPGNGLMLSAISALTVSPPFVRASCHDLRPAIALGAFAVAIATACLSRAPRSHLWAIAVLGLLVREDAAVILALAAAWLSLDGRGAEARRLFALVLGYVVLFHALYFGFLSFRYTPHVQTIAVWIALLLVPLLASIPARAHETLSRVHGRHRAWTILALALPFVVVWLEPVFGGNLVRSALARSFPAFLLAGIAATYWLLADGPMRLRRVATGLALVAIVPALASSVWMIADLRAMADRRAPVWALAERIPRGTPILTDFAHYQAFAGRDRLLVWERLPAAVEPTEAREFPASRLGLVALLVDLDGLVIVSDSSYARLTGALRSAGIEPSFEVCAEEATFVVARPRTGHTPCPAP
jgi:hypothetical protein